jgi:hypothetical protein
VSADGAAAAREAEEALGLARRRTGRGDGEEFDRNFSLRRRSGGRRPVGDGVDLRVRAEM